MADVPISQQELEDIIFNVARDLVEEAAIEGRIEEPNEEDIMIAVNEVAFVISKYMEYFNLLMHTKAMSNSSQSKLII
jgi:hypothetical protein